MTSAIGKGIRAAVATLVPFFLAAKLGHTELGWMALGGWLDWVTVTTPDQGESAMQLVTHARRLTNACTALDTRAAYDVADDEAGRESQLLTIATYAEGLDRGRVRVA